MVHSCSAFNCTERKTKECPYTFHSFPRNELRRKEWLKAMKRENFNVNEYSKICSKHFEKSCFIDKNGKAYLKSSAIPTIFGFPENNEKSDQSSSLIPLSDLTVRKKRKHYIGDFKSGDLLSLKVATQLLKKAQLDLSFKNKTIRNLKARNETLSKRVEFLKEVLQNIQKKCLHKESTKNVLLEVGLMAKRAILTRCGSDRKKTYAIKFNFARGVCLNQSSQANSSNQLDETAPSCTGAPKEVCLITQKSNLPQCSLNGNETRGIKFDFGTAGNINPSSKMNSSGQSEKPAPFKKSGQIRKKTICTQYSSNEKDSCGRDADPSAKTNSSCLLKKHAPSDAGVTKEVGLIAKKVILPHCGSDRQNTCDDKFDFGGVTLNPSPKANSSYQSSILSSTGVPKVGGMVPWGASIRDEPCPGSPEKIFMEL